MSDQDRGALLLQQEQIQNQIQQIRQQLTTASQMMSRFAAQLTQRPENIVFSNAPSPLGNFGPELMGAPSIEWNQLKGALGLEGIAQLIQDLRAKEKELQQVQQRLYHG